MDTAVTLDQPLQEEQTEIVWGPKPDTGTITLEADGNYIVSWTRRASQAVLVVKNPPANAGDLGDVGSIPGSGRSPGGGLGHPFQYSCLENPMNRGAWQAIVHRVSKNWTWLSTFAGNCNTSKTSRLRCFLLGFDIDALFPEYNTVPCLCTFAHAVLSSLTSPSLPDYISF